MISKIVDTFINLMKMKQEIKKDMKTLKRDSNLSSLKKKNNIIKHRRRVLKFWIQNLFIHID